MGSLSFGEILTIAIVVLLVFGPKRLPDLARRAGALLAKARETVAGVTEAIQREYGEAAAPIEELKNEVTAAGREVRGAVTSLGEAIESDLDQGSEEDGSASSQDDETPPSDEPTTTASVEDTEDTEDAEDGDGDPADVVDPAHDASDPVAATPGPDPDAGEEDET